MGFLFFIFSLIVHIFLFFSLSSHLEFNLNKNIKYSVYKVQLVEVRVAKKRSLNTSKNTKKVVKDKIIKIADKRIKKINRHLDKNATNKRKAEEVDIKGIISSLEKEVKTSQQVNIAAKEIKNLEKEIGYYGNNTGIVGKNVEDEYKSICDVIVHQNWRKPRLRLEENFEAVVKVKIDETGRILHAEIKKSSGDGFIDTTILRAIYSSTLPPPPQGVDEIEFTFTP